MFIPVSIVLKLLFAVLVILVILACLFLLAKLLASRHGRRVLIALACVLGVLVLLTFLSHSAIRPVAPVGLQRSGRVPTRHAIAPAGRPLAEDAAPAVPPAARPKWVDAPDGYVGEEYEMTVAAGPYSTDPECDAAVIERAAEKVEDYLSAAYASSGRIAPETLRPAIGQWVTGRYRETLDTTVGPMRQLYVRLAIGSDARRWFDEQFRQATIGRRTAYFGTGLAGVLAALAAAWLLLRRR